MKLSKNIVIFFVLIVCILTNSTKINTFASGDIDDDFRKINNVAVLSIALESVFLNQINNYLKDLQNQNKDKIQYTFIDLKRNVSSQNAALDSLLKSNFDLVIALLPDSTEETVKDIILKIRTKNIPILFVAIDPNIIKSVSHYYDKVAFISEDANAIGISQGRMIADEWNANKQRMDKNRDGILQYILIKAITSKATADKIASSSISSINISGIPTEELQILNIDWSKDTAKIGIENAFIKYDGKIEAIISIGDNMAIGAIEGLQKYGYNTGNSSKYIPVFGIDGIPEAIALIDKGFMAGTVFLDPKEAAKAIYLIGMNLINNLNPIENTSYKIVNGEILVFQNPTVYIKKINATPTPQ